MAPKDPATAALPGAEVPPAPVKDVSNPPIHPIAKDASKELAKDASKELAKDASKELAKDASKELAKDASKGGNDGKSKTNSKKKVSGAVKVDAVEPATEVKVAEEVVTVEAKVEPSGVKEMAKSSSTEPSAAKQMPNISSAGKVEMPMPSATKERPIIPSAAKVVEMSMPSTTKPSAAKVEEMPMPSKAKLSAAKEMPIIPSAAGAEEYPEMLINQSAIKVEVPDTPPVVSSLTKPSQISVSSAQPHVEEDEVVVLMETVSKKFGEMTFSDYNSAEDIDFCLSEAEMDDDSEDSLEWASETERTRAEDDLSEDKVGIDYISAALDIATEQAASFRIVQAGLVIGDWFLGAVESISCISSSEVAPLLSSVRRSARKIRRAGERESGPFRPLGMVSESTMKMATTFLAAPLALLGWEFRPVTQAKAKKVVSVEDELNQEPCTFEELDLSDYDSDMDADYLPSEESSSEDDLEFRTDAAESTEAEESVSEEN